MLKSPDILALLRSKRLWILIVLLWAAAYLPFLGSRDLRQEEGRRATPAREMVTTGDYLTPRLYGQPYLSKPPGYFWIIAGVGKIQGAVTQLTPRIPSVLGMLLGAILMFSFARRDLPREARALAALMLLSTVVLLDKGALGEIDSLLAALVFATLVTFYNGYRAAFPTDGTPARSMLPYWLLIGALGGVMVLLKGPGGPLQIIPPVLAFLLWERRLLRVLFSPGALVALLLAAAPTVLWIYLLQSRGHFDLAHIYANQVGLDTVGVTAPSAEPVEPENARLLTRYLYHFPYQMLTMPLPWLIWAVPAYFKRTLAPAKQTEVASAAIPPTLRRFLICSTLIMILPFYLWPAALGRHVLTMVYPVCVLAAAWITADAGLIRSTGLRRGLLFVSTVLACVPVAAGVAAIGLTWQLFRPGLPVAILLAVGGVVLTVFLTLVIRRSLASAQLAGFAFAFTLAITLLAGRAFFATAFVPWKAATDQTRLARAQLEPLLAGASEIYTTEYFRPATWGSSYNIQFYAGPSLKALQSPADLPAGRPVTVIATAANRDALLAAGVELKEIGLVYQRPPPSPHSAKVDPPGTLYVFIATRP